MQEALEIVGLADYAERQISQLSGGQFQRVLIARCLVQEADYILLDEPFVGIDSVSEGNHHEYAERSEKAGRRFSSSTTTSARFPTISIKSCLVNREVIAFGPTKETFTEANLKEATVIDSFQWR